MGYSQNATRAGGRSRAHQAGLSRALRCTLFEGSPYPPDTNVRGTTKPAFPYSDHGPTSSAKLASYPSVPLLVVLYFLPPLLRVGPWADVLAAVVAVPKAAIDEYGHLLGGPREIRSSGQGQMPSPTLDPGLAQQLRHADLRRLVAGTLDAGHELGTAQVAERSRSMFPFFGPTTHNALPASSVLLCRRVWRTAEGRRCRSFRKPCPCSPS